MATMDDRYLRTGSDSIANPKLTAALFAALTRDTPETRKQLYEALSQAMLILPASEVAVEQLADGAVTLEDAASSLRVKTYTDHSGETLLVAFTDEDAVLAWVDEGTPYIALRGYDLLALAAHNTVAELILNPGGPVSGIIRRGEIASLVRGELPAHPQGEAPVPAPILVSKPVQLPPQPLLEGLRQLLQRQPVIEAAYLFQIQTGSAEPRLVVGVSFKNELDLEQQDAAMDLLLADFDVISPEQDDGLEFLILDSEDFLRVVRDTIPPLFQR